MRRGPRSLPLVALVAALVAGCGGSKIQPVPPSLLVTPTSIDFGLVAVGDGGAQSLSLSAGTAKPVEINSVGISDDGDDSSAAFAVGAVPAQVSPGSPYSLAITFEPSAPRTYRATLTVTSNDANHPHQTIALSGSGGEPDIQVSLQCSQCPAAVATDGGLSIDFGVVPVGLDAGGGWPAIAIANQGAEPAALLGYSLTPDGGPFYLPTPPSLPQPFPAGEARLVPLAVQLPPRADATPISGMLTLQFDDPVHPQAQIRLSATPELAHAPSVCAGVVSALELDGSTQRAASLGSPPAIEPGAVIQLSAFSDDIADAGASPCSWDLDYPRSALQFAWQISSAPSGSAAQLLQPSTPRPTFTPDQPGSYTIELTVTDPAGLSGQAAAAFVAAPLEDLTVTGTWAGSPGVDLDLHFVRPGGSLFDPAYDIYSLNPDGGFSWGTPGDPSDKPHFSGDDRGDGSLRESTWLDHPGDSCLPDGGCVFQVWVHYYQDNRSLAGNATCGGASCTEGQPCGCSGGQVCEPDPLSGGLCAAPPSPQAEVQLRGKVAPALKVPVVVPFDLPSPCFAWHAFDVLWGADGGVAHAFGDGGLIQYWGDHTDETRQCVEPAGGWSTRSPPTFP